MNESIDSLKIFGKSFYWAGMILPKHYLQRSADLYYFCRKLDDIADQKKNKKNLIKLESIKKFIIQDNYTELSNINIYVPNFLKKKQNAKKAILDLIDGLIFDQGKVRVKNINELIIYCYRVAGTVGILMCIALDCKDKEAKNFAIDLGIAMQLTNITRDILEDAKMDRRYLPSSITKDIFPIDILTISEKKKYNVNDYKLITNALEKLLSISEEYYISGKKGLHFLPFKIRLSIAVAANVYREIGIKVKTKSFDWISGREYTSIFTKTKITIYSIFYEILFYRNKKPNHDNKLHHPIKEFIK